MRNLNDIVTKAIEREKWFPMVHPTNIEMEISYSFNAFLDTLKGMNDEEIITTLRIYKDAMINIALAINKEL